MLLELQIDNIALIESLSVQLTAGLNVLTGETGAGKSIILDAARCVTGGRTSKELIRTNAEKARVEAVFEMIPEIEPIFAQLGIEMDDMIILSREITVSGKNICRINGRMVTLSILHQAGQLLMDIHGQHDNQSLLKQSVHLSMLDGFGGQELLNIVNEYHVLWQMYCTAKKELNDMKESAGDIERKKDILKYQINEITAANLKIDELKELEEQKIVLKNFEKINESLLKSDVLLSGDNHENITSMLSDVISCLDEIAYIGEKYKKISESVNEAFYLLEDAAIEIKRETESREFSNDQIELLEERLDTIRRLQKKYGDSVSEIIQYYEKAAEELDELDHFEQSTEELEKKVSQLFEKVSKLAGKLTVKRTGTAKELEKKIIQQLHELDMPGAMFKVNFEQSEVPHKDGQEKIEFLISANKGEPLKPLAKVASGGELSRIMLSIKSILADIDNIPVLIFDEIDTGISGIAAQKVADKLKELGKSHQILCVTHHAQIASNANHQLLVHKEEINNQTLTMVETLQKDKRIFEIARLLSGAKITDISIKHAKELLKN